MKYIFTTILTFFGFWATFFAVKVGYLFSIDHFFVSLSRTPWLTWFFFLTTDVGSVASVVLLSLVVILFLVVKGRYREFVCMTFSLLGGLLLQTVIKYVLAIPRPEQSLVGTVGYSFPSGHANMTTILCLSAYVYIFSKTNDVFKRKVMLALMIFIPFMVGVSRVYLNAHWVSDVLAGWLLGIFWVALPLAYSAAQRHFTKR